MGITEGMYPTFKRLSEKVVNPAIADINRLSDFRVTVDYQRQSRKVAALKFKIRRVVYLPDKGQGVLFPEWDDMPVVVRELKEAGISLHEAWEIWQQGFGCVYEGVRPAVPSEQANEAFEHYIREKIHLLKRNLASGKVESITGFLLDAIRKNFANPEYAQERKRHEVVEALKVNKKRKTQIERFEGQKAEIEKARDEALRETYEELARIFPEVLEAALGSIFVGNKFLNQSYEHDKSPLENYQERLIMKVSSEQAPRYQPWSKHLRVWTGKDEASVGESDPQRLKDASVVHQHIHRAEDVRRFFEHALHIGRLGDVSLDRDRLATMAGHLRHGALRSCF